MHAATKARTEHSGNKRQLRTATNDVEAGDVAAELADTGCIRHQKRLHRSDRRFNEGSGGLVEIGDRNRDGLPFDRYGDELRRRGEGLLGVARVFDQLFPRSVAECA